MFDPAIFDPFLFDVPVTPGYVAFSHVLVNQARFASAPFGLARYARVPTGRVAFSVVLAVDAQVAERGLHKGDLVDIFGQFEDETGAVITPGSAVLNLMTPAGVASTPAVLSETAPTALTLAYEAAGYNIGIRAGQYYRYRLNLTEEGTYTGKWASAGAGQAATPDFNFIVEASVF